MKLFALALPLFACASVAAADPIDRVVADQMAVSHLPGVAVAVVDNGKVSKLAAYGRASLEWPSKVDVHTRFQIASATKLFTGILLMRLVEQHKLSLDDSVASFFPGAPEAWSHIKVRQLANHSSGLSEDTGNPSAKTPMEVVAASMKRPLAYPTGTEARYGFTDFTVLRAIIEKVGGKPLPDLLDQELLKPLGMTETGFAKAEDGEVRTGELIAKRAAVYRWADDHYRTSDFFFTPLGYGAGGIYASIEDLAKLFAAIDKGRVLSEASLKELATDAKLPDGRTSGFGIGWTVRKYRGTSIIGHSGGPALADIIRIGPQHRTIIVLTNEHLFYPMLAERIAELDLPDKRSAIRDDRPAAANNFKALWNAVANGSKGSEYVAAGADPAEPLRDGFGKALVEAVGPAKKVELLEVQPDGQRRYRVQFERKFWDWLVKVDPQDRIVDFNPG